MYLPNSAPTNRMLGFLKAFSEMGCEVEAAFLEAHTENAKADASIPNVEFKYCGGKSHLKEKLIRWLISFWHTAQYVKSIPQGSNVFLLGTDSYLPLFLKRHDLNVFYESTEHPSLSRKIFGIKRYIEHCKQLKHIFVISESLKDFYINNGINQDKVSIINMTVDPSRFVGLTKQAGVKRYIAYCGTASNCKDGVDELIKAFSICHQRHPDVFLYIIGATPDKEDKAGNMALIKRLGVEDAIVFTGIVDSSQMPQLLKNAEVLALDRPDSIQAKNGFPTKLGEYLLTENPVVVTKVGDIPLFLKDGVSALLSEERNATEFSSKLCWALEHPKEASLIGKAGKEVALQSFDCNIESKKILTKIFD